MISGGLVRLLDGTGRQVAIWKRGEFPDWLATYLNTLPNESAACAYRIEHGHESFHVPVGPLAIEVHHILLKLEMTLQERDQMEGQADEEDQAAPPCTCDYSPPHAVNCKYRYWKALRKEQTPTAAKEADCERRGCALKRALELLGD